MPRMLRLPAAIVIAAATALIEYWLMPRWIHGNTLMLVLALISTYGFIVALRLARASAHEETRVKVVPPKDAPPRRYLLAGCLLLLMSLVLAWITWDRSQSSMTDVRQGAWFAAAMTLVMMVSAGAALRRGFRAIASGPVGES